MIVVPVAPSHATAGILAEKPLLTNRIRSHFARIKAAGLDCGQCG
jgi:hypothetical protein